MSSAGGEFMHTPKSVYLGLARTFIAKVGGIHPISEASTTIPESCSAVRKESIEVKATLSQNAWAPISTGDQYFGSPLLRMFAM